MSKIRHRIKNLLKAQSGLASEPSIMYGEDFSNYSITSIIGMRDKLTAKRREFSTRMAESEKLTYDYETMLTNWSERANRAQDFIKNEQTEQKIKSMIVILETAESYMSLYNQALTQVKEKSKSFKENISKMDIVINELLAFERSHQLKTSLTTLQATLATPDSQITDQQEIKELRLLTYTARALIDLKIEELGTYDVIK